jgi:hypothetical protein
MMKPGILNLALVIGSVLSIPGCNRAAHTSNSNLDACSLVTKEEITAMQGSEVSDAKNSLQINRGFRVTQCFYTTREFSKSVVISVTQRDADHPGDRTPKDFWNQSLHREKEKEPDEGEREEEEKGATLTRIDGVGDEAYWAGVRFGGALYVFKKDLFLRISVGGNDTEQGKIGKAKAVALKALGRL